MEEFRFNDALGTLWSMAMELNQRIERVRPWEMLREGEAMKQGIGTFLDEMVTGLRCIGCWLEPFLPDTAEELNRRFGGGTPLRRGAPLFPRLR